MGKRLLGGLERIRTAVEGFADLCLATRPRDPVMRCKFTKIPGIQSFYYHVMKKSDYQ